MNVPKNLAAISLAVMLLASSAASAQQTSVASASATSSAVPTLVNFSGKLTDLNGKPLTGVVGVTFALYTNEQSASPLWLETQNVTADKYGRYSVQLGATRSAGLPSDIFVAGEARWLGVQPQGQAECPRVMLLSVPYALKAGDAQTLGGLPPSAFLLASPGNTTSAPAPQASTAPGAPPADGPVTGLGTVGFVPLWDSTSDIVNSSLFQSGSGSSAKVGIGTTAPAATLDVKGTATLRGTTSVLGTLALPATGTATSTTGKNSQPATLAASSFSSTTKAAVAQTFQWQAEPSGNNSSTPSGTLNLLFGSGTSKPTETGLKVANTGQITFATGQTFPGTGNGTVTSVASGTGLTGGPITTTGTLAIDPTVVPELGAASNTFSGSITASNFSGNGAGLTNVNAATLGGFPPSAFQPAGSYATLGANTFSGTQSITGANLALDQTVNGNDGVITMGGTPLLHACCSSAAANTFLGLSAGNLTLSGGGNTAIGWSALPAVSSGNANTAVGTQALFYDSTGPENTAVGVGALAANVSGNSNIAVGADALNANTGSTNSALGTRALNYNTSGSGNVAVGDLAGVTSNASNANSTGSNNTFLGFQSGPGTTTQLTNATAIGANALVSASNSLVLGGTGANSVSVGIGTATPAATLDVHGTANFTGPITFAAGQTFPGGTVTGNESVTGNVSSTGQLISTVATGTAPLTVNSTTQVPNLNASLLAGQPASNFATVASNTFSGSQAVNGNITATGNVGIGNSFPILYKLQVGTAGVTTGNFRVEGPTASGTSVPAGSFGGFGDFGIDAPGIANGRFVVKESGLVGIGKAAPTSQLEVHANASAAFTIYAVGFSAPSGSGKSGSTALEAFGGSGDPSSGTAGPGWGIAAQGGNSVPIGAPGVYGAGGNANAGGQDGEGGYFQGGSNGGRNGVGVAGQGGSSDGVVGQPGFGAYAGNFNGDVNINGTVYTGAKDFRIDHPLDPANKYLLHASIESSEMMNLYTGNVTTDARGEATVHLPDWFEVVNTDFRYQLTVIGQFAQAIVSREIEGSEFKIRTNVPNVKVSWQVTGVRQDAYAKAHPLIVEQEKEARLKGYYIHPELYGQPEEKQIEWVRNPRMMKQMKEVRARLAAASQMSAAQPH